MNKLGAVLIIIGVVIGCYLILLVTQTVVVNLVESANATITASSNLTNYPGTQGFLLSTPWIMWFVPGVIGMIAIVIILRRP